MKKIIIIFILIISCKLLAREIGQTEISTEEGIEVFQKEKYYLLKKNVSITSDNFELVADKVKAYFNEDLYDIEKIESEGNVTLKSNRGLVAKGVRINFSIKNENIIIIGENSSLVYKNIDMFSNKQIKVNNISGEFEIIGKNSKLLTEDIKIYGEFIDGKYITINEMNEIENLYVEDPITTNIITNKLNMFSKKADYKQKDNLIELFENVKIIRDSENISGDYAKIDTYNESYKVYSNENKKVKILIEKENLDE